ncbi:hypothetical protein [Streptomyces griseoluteus]|uniref:hypothetical protein n=1 Tax=Streptomyces griseoluteus TaxID=29306 RepID=UPI00381D6BC0
MTAPVDALSPVRAELLRAARVSAGTVRDRARAEAEEALRSARASAEAVLARARDVGTADGATAAARERVGAVQDAWTAELAARAEVYASLRAAVLAGVRKKFAEDASLRSRCEEAARRVLGPQARVTPVPEGGVRAEVPGRRIDLSADALAERALNGLGVRAETLWEPT